MTTHIILDTDIGTDVDDAVALALALNAPELALTAVTCVYGEVQLRQRIVRKLLALAGSDAVPVYAGASQPLLGKRAVHWGGYEGRGLLEDAPPHPEPDPGFAPVVIAELARQQPGELHLVCIGPLTNAALAFALDPALARNLAGLTIMGGTLRTRFELPYAEHNIRSDPEAAHIVFESGVPITMVPLDVTTQVRLREEDVARLRAVGTPFHNALAQQIAAYPRFIQHGGWTHMHDPLAVASLFAPELLSFTPLHVDVEIDGEYTAGMTLARPGPPTNARIALDVQAAEFEALLIDRLVQHPTGT